MVVNWLADVNLLSQKLHTVNVNLAYMARMLQHTLNDGKPISKSTNQPSYAIHCCPANVNKTSDIRVDDVTLTPLLEHLHVRQLQSTADTARHLASYLVS